MSDRLENNNIQNKIEYKSEASRTCKVLLNRIQSVSLSNG